MTNLAARYCSIPLNILTVVLLVRVPNNGAILHKRANKQKVSSLLKLLWAALQVVSVLQYTFFNTLAQWGERSLSERSVQVLFPVRPDNKYTVFCWHECPYKMNTFHDYSVYLNKVHGEPPFKKLVYGCPLVYVNFDLWRACCWYQHHICCTYRYRLRSCQTPGAGHVVQQLSFSPTEAESSGPSDAEVLVASFHYNSYDYHGTVNFLHYARTLSTNLNSFRVVAVIALSDVFHP